jgi:hypothetical protein
MVARSYSTQGLAELMKRSDFRLQTAISWTQLIANAVVAISAIAAVVTYYQSRADARVERTLQIVQRFESEDFSASRAKVSELASRTRDALQSNAAALAVLDTGESHDLRTRLLLAVEYEGQPDPPAALTDVTGYFATLQSCIEQHVCDANTAHGFLGSYANALWQDIKDVAAFERAHSRPNFAAGIETFAASSKATQ